MRKMADINLVRIKDKKKQESDVFDSTSFQRAQQISLNFKLFAPIFDERDEYGRILSFKLLYVLLLLLAFFSKIFVK